MAHACFDLQLQKRLLANDFCKTKGNQAGLDSHPGYFFKPWGKVKVTVLDPLVAILATSALFCVGCCKATTKQKSPPEI